MSAKKILGVVLTVASIALIATGVGAPLGLGGIGIALGGAFISDAVLLGIGLGIAGSFLLGPSTPKLDAALTGNQVNRLTATLVPTTPRKIIFGHTALDTDVRYQAFTGANQEYLEMIVCHASHEVHSIDEYWPDNEQAWTLGGGVLGRYVGYLTVTPITEGTSINGVAIDANWTASCTLTGCAYSHMKFKLTGNSDKVSSPFASGVTSRMTFRGKGAKVYDPRLDSTVAGGSGTQRANDQTTWAWDDNASRNLALQELFYELGWKIGGKLAVGKGVPPSRIDLASYAVAANHCDESITLNGGGTEPRYRGDGVVSEGDDPGGVRDNLCAAMNAILRDAGGKLALSVIVNDLASPVTPSGKSAFDQFDIQGQMQWDQTPDLSSTFNIVRGRRIDPSDQALYQPVDLPEQSLTSVDGIDRIDTVDYPFVQSNGQGQRLLKQRLERNQYQGRLTFTGQPSFWGLSLGDVFPLTHPTFGWSAKLFRCVSQQINRMGATQIIAVEENAAIYAWANNEAAPVTPGTPTIYDPTNNALVVGIDVAAAAAAPGDSNRVRFSRMERGTLGWSVLSDPSGIGGPVTTSTFLDKVFVECAGNFTASSQSLSFGSRGYFDPVYRIPVTPGERIFASAQLGIGVPATTGSWTAHVLFADGSGTTTGQLVLASATGSGLPSWTRCAQFGTVPANSVYAVIEVLLFSNAGGAGAYSASIAEPMLCGAGALQTVFPAFTPGPSSEPGADISSAIDVSSPVTVFADSTGTPKSGEISKALTAKLIRAGLEVTSGVAWAASRTLGNATFTISGTGAADFEITGPNDSSFAVENEFELTATYLGIQRTKIVKVVRQDDPPTVTGATGSPTTGTTGSTTTLGATTGTAYDTVNAVSSILTATAGPSGQVTCSAPLSFKRTGVTLGSGPDGENGAAGKWQWRVVGGTFADITTEVTSAADSITDADPDTGKHRTSPGSLSVTHTKTGLTSGTAYEFRFCWRRIDVVATAENVSASSGALQAVGS